MAHVENNVQNTQNVKDVKDVKDKDKELVEAFNEAHEDVEKIPYILKYTENNKTLVLRKKTITKLVEVYKDLNKDALKNYYSYKNNHKRFDAVLALLENKPDIFAPVVD